VGATGLIGSAVATRLSAEGFEVLATWHNAAGKYGKGLRWIKVDIAQATAQQWISHLRGVDSIVNCAGVLQDGYRESTHAVHHRGPVALFEACERAGVRRVVHFSAIGVDTEQPTEFSRSKAAGDVDLMGRNLDWVILRPSVIMGRSAYGGSALV